MLARFELAKGRSLAIVRHAEVLNAHLGIRESWSRIQLAGHVAEIAAKMGIENHPDPDLYTLTLRALDEIDRGLPQAVLKFKVGLLDHLGIFPDLAGCAECGSSRAKGRVHLDETGGGFLCSECAKSRGIYHPVPMQVLHVMHALRVGAELPENLQPENLDETEDVLTHLLQSFLQAPFKTVPAERRARTAERDRMKNIDSAKDLNSDA